MSRVSTHWRTHKRTNGITVVTFARVEYSAAVDADWVAPGHCRPANQRAARLGRAGIARWLLAGFTQPIIGKPKTDDTVRGRYARSGR